MTCNVAGLVSVSEVPTLSINLTTGQDRVFDMYGWSYLGSTPDEARKDSHTCSYQSHFLYLIGVSYRADKLQRCHRYCRTELKMDVVRAGGGQKPTFTASVGQVLYEKLQPLLLKLTRSPLLIRLGGDLLRDEAKKLLRYVRLGANGGWKIIPPKPEV